MQRLTANNAVVAIWQCPDEPVQNFDIVVESLLDIVGVMPNLGAGRVAGAHGGYVPSLDGAQEALGKVQNFQFGHALSLHLSSAVEATASPSKVAGRNSVNRPSGGTLSLIMKACNGHVIRSGDGRAAPIHSQSMTKARHLHIRTQVRSLDFWNAWR